MNDLTWMVLPIAALVVVVITLGWFGLHVLERGVIFVDLALAQVAALGTTYAVYLGHEPDGAVAFGMALAATFVGAGAFAAARIFEDRVPQEAIIGIAYAVSAATGILVIHFAADPHGAEKLQHLLVGNIVWVQGSEVALLAGICAVVGLFHVAARERFLQVSYRPAEAVAEGRHVAAWDLLFYLSFGLALAAIVSITGVLLVFSYLVIPAVVARLLVAGVARRLLVAWALGIVVSVAGVAVSYEHPTGPVIVTMFGAVLLVALAGYAIARAKARGIAAAQVLGALGAVLAILLGARALPVGESHAEDDDDGHAAEATAPALEFVGDPLRAADPATRDAAARLAPGDPVRVDALAAALDAEPEESVRLTMAVALVRAGDCRGLRGLAALTRSEAPFLRMEADTRLRALAGAEAPEFDPIAGPDAEGRWDAWAGGQIAVPGGGGEIGWP